MEPKFTIGPWHINAIDSKRNRIVGDETAPRDKWDKLKVNNYNATIATVYHIPDARLIAAAPDLLAALRAVHTGFMDGTIKWAKPRQADSEPYHPANILMTAALAKAESKS